MSVFTNLSLREILRRTVLLVFAICTVGLLVLALIIFC